MGEYEQALSYYEEAIRIDPLFADAYSNMGNLLKELGRLDEAITKYEMAIQLKPHFADAHNNLACAYKDCGRVPEAIEYYRKTLALKPDSVDAFCNLVHSQLFICDWTDCDSNFARIIAIVDKQLRAGQLPSVQPFHALTYPVSRKMFLQICGAYSMRACVNVAGLLQRGPLFSTYHIGIPGEKIRVGYVSSDFANHPLAHLMQHVFCFHDKSRFDIFCFALTPDDQSMYRKNIMHFATQFHDISALSPEQAARFIHMHHIHVLVNLNGYTKGARNEIFVLQPAPIQVSYMGFPGTTGSTHIQYFVVDHVVAPPELESSFSEKLLRMPHSYFVNDHLQSFPYLFEESVIATGPKREYYGLPPDKVIYCMFNQLYKLDRHIFDVWCKILKRVPRSVLWLLQFPAHAEVCRLENTSTHTHQTIVD
jgi:protein O-GlcNAc transferase